MNLPTRRQMILPSPVARPYGPRILLAEGAVRTDFIGRVLGWAERRGFPAHNPEWPEPASRIAIPYEVGVPGAPSKECMLYARKVVGNTVNVSGEVCVKLVGDYVAGLSSGRAIQEHVGGFTVRFDEPLATFRYKAPDIQGAVPDLERLLDETRIALENAPASEYERFGSPYAFG